MTLFIFIVGLIVSVAVCYALFAYTVHEMAVSKNAGNPNKKS